MVVEVPAGRPEIGRRTRNTAAEYARSRQSQAAHHVLLPPYHASLRLRKGIAVETASYKSSNGSDYYLEPSSLQGRSLVSEADIVIIAHRDCDCACVRNRCSVLVHVPNHTRPS